MTEKEHKIYREALADLDRLNQEYLAVKKAWETENDSLKKTIQDLKQQYKDLKPYTCIDIDCSKRKQCRIKNGVFVTTPDLNVRLKASDYDRKIQFIPVMECSSKTEAFITAFDIMKAHKWQSVEVYIDDKKIATIYG